MSWLFSYLFFYKPVQSAPQIYAARQWLSICIGLSLALVTSMSLATDLQFDLTQLSLEELMHVEITTVAKKEQPLFESPAAVYVITREDIRRAGFTSISEALRLAPGLQVARLDANKWAITARGFNGRFANKLLVLIDGRIVYTPLFSGVFWEVQDLLLEDVERIEVIRGPGATLWGANAVNGVINIITRGARDTQGGLVRTGTGSEERGFGALRYGGALSPEAHYRIYAKYFKRDAFVDAAGAKTADDWDIVRGGFRLDWEPPHPGSLTLIGDMYGGTLGQTLEEIASPQPPYIQSFDFDTEVAGASLLGRWKHRTAAGADLTLGLFLDRSERQDVVFDEVRHTLDMDFQQHFAPSLRQDVVWGLGYRLTSDRLDSTFLFIDPPERKVQIFSAFVQDEIALAQNRLRLTLGSKLEHNDFTGIEIQPNVRLLWMPSKQHATWAAAPALATARRLHLPAHGYRHCSRQSGFRLGKGSQGCPQPSV
jgi:iron complex outermembrane receptor protein